MQSDLFSILFNTDDIADSTVNNYCTGFRAINIKYKNYFKNILITTVAKIMELVENETINNAIKMFNIAISTENVYAYNNLGQIYETSKDYKNAFNCYTSFANLGESWATNKGG